MKKTVTRKIYRAIMYKSLSVQLFIGNDVRLVSFMHSGATSGQTAYLTTDDPVVQEALENSPGYGKDFYLERQVNYIKEVPDIPKPIVENKYVNADGVESAESETAPAAEEGESLPEDERPLSPEEAVTNMAMAKTYLLDKFSNDKAQIVDLKRADEVREFAKSKGIVFPNWA